VNPAANVHVQSESSRDRDAIRAVTEAAFGRPAEADLIDGLRMERAVLLSLVALVDQQLIGHVLFSRMLIETERGSVAAVALAPVSVLPDLQRQGVGGALIRHGLQRLRGRGERIVIVVGHPAYYSRFGFVAASAHGLVHPFPPEAFMALELASGALDGLTGTVRYAAAFGT
jgi:putative acetyltransferase